MKTMSPELAREAELDREMQHISADLSALNAQVREKQHIKENMVVLEPQVREKSAAHEKSRKGPKLTKSAWTVQWPSWKETYYNLPMHNVVDSLRSQWIKGVYWVRADGVKMYGKYVMVAANGYPKGTIIPTTLGPWMVCDRGGMKGKHIDIAVNWGSKPKKKKK